MAISETTTLLSIDEYGAIMGFDMWSLNQFTYPGPKSAQCSDVIYQYGWQRDHLSREEIGRAIAEAEYLLAEQLGYWPAPQYIFDEHVPYPRPHNRTQYGMAATWRGNWKAVQLRWGKFIGGGSFTRTLIGDTANLTLSDSDGDGVNDTFTCTIATTVTDPNEIAVYFRTTDRLGNAISEQWRIRPITVTISGGTATIKGHATLLVPPTLTHGVDVAALTATLAANYVTNVTVYRVWRDTTHTDANPAQGVAVWDVPEDCTSDCQIEIKPLCLQERLNETGQPHAAWDQTSCLNYWWEADRLQVNYLAGEKLVNNRMEPEHARIVAYLATALISSEKCGCDRTNRVLSYWQRKVNEGDTGRAFTTEEINQNPFGEPRVGALWAWRRVNSLRLGQGVGV